MPKSDQIRNAAPDDGAGLIQACRRLHAAIDQLDAKACQAAGISRNDLRCLNLLEAGPLAPKEIAQSLSLTSGSVTALLDRLESRGFVRRSPHPEDRRALLIEIMPRVFAELSSVYRPLGEALVELAERYKPANLRAAAGHLNDVALVCEAIVAMPINKSGKK